MKRRNNKKDLLKIFNELAGIRKYQKFNMDKFIIELRKSKRINIKRR